MWTVLTLVDGGGSRFKPSSPYTAAIADRMEYSTVKTTSSASSQNCPVKARLVHPSVPGRSIAYLPTEKLTGDNGIMQGMQVEVSRIRNASASIRRGPMISVMISRPVHACMGFLTKSPSLSTNKP